MKSLEQLFESVELLETSPEVTENFAPQFTVLPAPVIEEAPAKSVTVAPTFMMGKVKNYIKDRGFGFVTIEKKEKSMENDQETEKVIKEDYYFHFTGQCKFEPVVDDSGLNLEVKFCGRAKESTPPEIGKQILVIRTTIRNDGKKAVLFWTHPEDYLKVQQEIDELPVYRCKREVFFYGQDETFLEYSEKGNNKEEILFRLQTYQEEAVEENRNRRGLTQVEYSLQRLDSETNEWNDVEVS